MPTISDIFKNTNTLHHAYIIAGSADVIIPEIEEVLGTIYGIATSGNPDFTRYYFETLGIEHVRALKAAQSMKGISGEKKFFIIVASSITSEAQNALLKTLEEPTPHTHFFIIVSDTHSLLPTLISRVVVIHSHAKSPQSVAVSDDVENFLGNKISARLEYVRKIIDKKDKDKAFLFLNEIEHTLFFNGAHEEEALRKYRFIFNEIANGRKYLRGRSPSLKLILEHIALIVPSVK